MIIANFKSNIVDYQKWVNDFMSSCPPVEFYVGMAPPFIYFFDNYVSRLEFWNNRDESDHDMWDMQIGAQDVDYSSGSRTGAISVGMLEEYAIAFVIIGHSERREFFHEDNDLIRKKIHAVNGSKLRPILCIGETKEENKEGITKDVLKNQLEVIDGLELGKNFTIAYEPVWAIGSGLTPEPKDINDIHKYIKDVVQSISANNLVPDVIYGGSVTNKNAKSFFIEEFVDGALVGGASLDGSTFGEIVNIWERIYNTSETR
ncbi:MAG: triose-phosphate isomerase [Gammaproteobacteria bacterium]|nr:triose-phosphate isomerase [Gammaproteobacteria bacterium]|tara:strand:+ start:1383 stop:2162 length:780 start_codon:yes stop_codon:yes gene_type:complete